MLVKSGEQDGTMTPAVCEKAITYKLNQHLPARE